MTLDHEQQRGLLLQLINAAQIPGAHVETVAALKAAVHAAKVEEKTPE